MLIFKLVSTYKQKLEDECFQIYVYILYFAHTHTHRHTHTHTLSLYLMSWCINILLIDWYGIGLMMKLKQCSIHIYPVIQSPIMKIYKYIIDQLLSQKELYRCLSKCYTAEILECEGNMSQWCNYFCSLFCYFSDITRIWHI